MIKDRLKELKQFQPPNTGDAVDANESAQDNDADVNVDDYVELEFEADHSKTFAGPIFKKYAEIIKDFEEIKTNLETLKSMLKAVNAHKFDETEFNKIRQKNVQLSNQVIAKFKKLESKLPQQTDFRTKARMKRSLYFGYFHQYTQLWADHEAVLQKYEAQLKKNLQMQSRILNYELTDEEIETLIANKQTNLLVDNILTDTEHAKQQLQELKNRLNDLIKLEKSISEVHGMFLRLQTLVVEQGEMMQNIEKHFNDAQEYVAEASRNIKVARELQRFRFGLKEKICIVGIILLIILLLVFFNSFKCFMLCKKK